MQITDLPAEIRTDFVGDENRVNWDSFRSLIDAARQDGGIIPFCGAGISAPFGFPTWTRFLENTARELGVERVEDPLMQGTYLEVADALVRGLHEHVASAIGDCRNGNGKLYLNARVDDCFGEIANQGVWESARRSASELPPAFTIPRITRGLILTTNFDAVIENVFVTCGQPFSTESVFSRPDPRKILHLLGTRQSLLKLHGGTQRERGRILTGSEYRSEYGHDSQLPDYSLPLPNLLLLLARFRPFLFIGCSLKQDRTMQILRAAAATQEVPMHFALVPRPGSAETERTVRGWLSDHAIRAIFYDSDGGHRRIRPVLEFLSRHIPTTEEVPLNMMASPARQLKVENFHLLHERHVQPREGGGFYLEELEIRAHTTYPITGAVIVFAAVVSGPFTEGQYIDVGGEWQVRSGKSHLAHLESLPVRLHNARDWEELPIPKRLGADKVRKALGATADQLVMIVICWKLSKHVVSQGLAHLRFFVHDHQSGALALAQTELTFKPQV